MKIAVVGATGLVGTKMLEILLERNFPVTQLIPVASANSVGKQIDFAGKQYTVHSMQDAIAAKPQIALFSAGGSTSLQYAPQFAAVGCTVIDNSSAWRMQTNIPLIVPEVNAHILNATHNIIANPNCSTIQMVVALKPLHDVFQIQRVVVSTYQSVTGSGIKAVNQMNNERAGITDGPMAYAYNIDRNAIPQIDVFTDNGYTKEEMKLVQETNKIMGDDSIRITATTVRIPVMGGHSESVNIQFAKPINIQDVKSILQNAPGIIVQDDIENLVYPMPQTAHNKDAVFVGRIRQDFSQDNSINCWIVSDNLRKGAATNAVQIAEYLVANQLV
jgi:aspartate-semialdehyde dehydrogenase